LGNAPKFEPKMESCTPPDAGTTFGLSFFILGLVQKIKTKINQKKINKILQYLRNICGLCFSKLGLMKILITQLNTKWTDSMEQQCYRQKFAQKSAA